jgi:arylsulfatase A-like enzyme
MANTQQPNIVLIVLDTHRRDRLSTYGYHRPTSPNIDDFARQATIFENGISPAQWTIPAHAAMFTGEYPTTHQALQVHDTLDSRFDTLSKHLRVNGYRTTGFCNNPLVGVLSNGLKRGFDTFYNYCGAVPSVPKSSNRLPQPIDKLWELYTQQLRKLSYPVQNAFAHSDFLFRLSLHPLVVPVWNKLANFKGHTANSIRDVTHFLHQVQSDKKPNFVFLNLMEPHTPYSPPDTYINEFVPYFKDDRDARQVIRSYNAEAYRWLLPLDESLVELEARVLSDMYDAEVSYQDDLLGPLLEYLSKAENTLTIIVADHGEGLGEHHFMGHSFVAYQELVHVPLIVKFPAGMAAGEQIAENVSTRRVFHTVLATAGIQPPERDDFPVADVQQFSLARTVEGQDPEKGLVFSEAYPPSTIRVTLEQHAPEAIDKFHCTLPRWAAYDGSHKLVRIAGVQDELFNLADTPLEEEWQDIAAEQPALVTSLSTRLDSFVTQATARQPDSWQARRSLSLKNDEALLKHLRALGYIE